MTKAKTAVFGILLVLAAGQASANDIQVEGLTEEGINATWTADGVNFKTDYLNKTVSYKKVFAPDNLSVKKWKISTKEKNNSLQVSVEYQVSQDSNYTYLAGKTFKGKIDIKKEKTKSNFVNGSISSTKDEVIEIESDAHYEHLILKYDLKDNGTVKNESQNVYSGNETSLIPLSNSSYTNDTYSAVYDGMYEGRKEVTVGVAVHKDADMNGFYAENLTVENLSQNYYSEVKQRVRDNNLSESVLLEDRNEYNLYFYNVTIPKDSRINLKADISRPTAVPTTSRMWVLGSIGAVKASFSSSSYYGSVAETSKGTFMVNEGDTGNIIIRKYKDGSESLVANYSTSSNFQRADVFNYNGVIYISSYDDNGNTEIFKYPIGGSVSKVTEYTANVRDRQSNSWKETKDHFIKIMRADSSSDDGLALFFNKSAESFSSTAYTYGYDHFSMGFKSDSTAYFLDDADVNGDSDGKANHLAYSTDGGSTISDGGEISGVDAYRILGAQELSGTKYVFFTSGNGWAHYSSCSSSCTSASSWSSSTNLSVKAKYGDGGLDSNNGKAYLYTRDNGLRRAVFDGSSVISDSYIESSGTWLIWGRQVDYSSNTNKIAIYPYDNDNSVFELRYESFNSAPSISSAEFTDNRKTGSQFLNFTLDDKGESDISDYNGLSSALKFTNSTLKSSISLPFSSTINVSDTKDAFSSDKNVDLSETDSGIREENFDHSENTQRINRTVTINNNAGSGIDYNLTLDLPGTVIQGQSWTGTISASSSVTHTAITEGDWITQTVSSLKQDNSSTSGLGTQYVFKSKDLSETGGYGFTGVNVSSPTLPGTCSNCNKREIDVPASTTVTELYNSSSDWITGETENNDRFEVSSYNHDEDNLKYKNETDLIVDNSVGFQLSSVDISSMCTATTSTSIANGTNVKATESCNSNTFSGDFITETVGNLKENTGKTHNLSTQYVAKDKTFNEQENISWTNVDLLAPSMPGTCTDCSTRTKDVAAGASITETYHSNSDFITGETVGEHAIGQNTSKTSGLGTQYGYNQTYLKVSNDRGFKFNSVDVSSKCSLDTTVNVPTGTNTVTTSCENKTVSQDYLDETVGEFDPTSDSVTLGVNYEGARSLDITETSGRFNWSNISTDSINVPKSCSITNNTAVDVPAGASVSKTIGYNCNPGSVGTTDHEVKSNTPTEDYEKHFWTTDQMEIASNHTENTTVVWKITESDLPEWDSRVDVDGHVDNNYKGIEIEDGVGVVYFRINTSHTNSSIHTGTHTAELTWTVQTDSDGGGGGGGGSGSTDDQTKNKTVEPVVTFFTDSGNKPLEYSLPAGKTSTFTVQIRNTLDERNRVGVEVPQGGGALCDYLTVQETVSASTYGKNGTYELPDKSTSLSSDYGARQVTFKVDMPSKQKFQSLSSSGELSCKLATKSTKAIAEKPVIRVQLEKTFLKSLNDALGFKAFQKEKVCLSPEALSSTGTSACKKSEVSNWIVPTGSGSAAIAGILFFLGSAAYIRRNEGWRIAA